MSDRRIFEWLVVVATLATVPSAASAGGPCLPPTNETCEGARSFSNANLPFEVTAPLGCVNDIIDKPYFDVFYRFDCTQTGMYRIHMCGSSGDTYVRVYTDGCGWDDGEELAVADDECPGSPPNADPLLQIALEAGQSYWIELGTWRPDPPWAPPPNSPYFFSMSFEVESPGPAGSLDVAAGPDFQLQIAKDGEELLLSWGNSCIAADTDYAIYEGQLDAMGVHSPLTCSTSAVTSYTTQAPVGDVYFLVNSQNDFVGGSYGTSSDGAQRPKGNPFCLPRFVGECL